MSRKFEVLISAEFGIKKRRLDIEHSVSFVLHDCMFVSLTTELDNNKLIHCMVNNIDRF